MDLHEFGKHSTSSSFLPKRIVAGGMAGAQITASLSTISHRSKDQHCIYPLHMQGIRRNGEKLCDLQPLQRQPRM